MTHSLPSSSDILQDDNMRKKHLDAWMTAKGRALRVLVCGLGGVGKSTLINRLLQLEDGEKWAEEGREGGPVTTVVAKHEKTTKRGVNVCLFDTPGFGDVDISAEKIIAEMERETEKKLDVVFYCFSLEGPTRVQEGDAKAIKIMTQLFSHEIWKKAVIVFTFANSLEAKVGRAEDYRRVVNRIKEKVKDVLRKEHVPHDIIERVPIVTAGYTEPILQYEEDECKTFGGWDNRLFLQAVVQVDPAVFPALFEARFSWTECLLAAGMAGVGGTLGAKVGGVIGTSGGLIGTGVRAAVGAGAGATLGAVGIGVEKVKAILKVKYEKWRLSSRLPAPRQVTEQ